MHSLFPFNKSNFYGNKNDIGLLKRKLNVIFIKFILNAITWTFWPTLIEVYLYM